MSTVHTPLQAEVICVGTELLLGQITNTNAQYLAQQLAEIGVDLYYQTVVGDNVGRIHEAIRIARTRANVLIFTGGLGPTADDITKEVVAEAFQCILARDPDQMEAIREMFLKRGLIMPEGNEKQADYFEGGVILANETGLALGSVFIQEGIYVVVLPGPPSELKPMVEKQLIPWLVDQMDQSKPIFSRTLRMAGIGESQVSQLLSDLIDEQTDPTIATYAHDGEVSVRLSTKCRDAIQAEMTFLPVVQEIEKRLGHCLYAYENISIEQQLIRQLLGSELTLATAESCSGGLLGDLLTNVPGVSNVYRGGFISYSNDAKTMILGVPPQFIEGHDAPGAISVETAQAMANSARLMLNSDVGLATTGVAGPDSVEGKPVGMTYVAVSLPNGKVVSELYNIRGNRQAVKLRVAKRVLYLAWRELRAGGWIE